MMATPPSPSLHTNSVAPASLALTLLLTYPEEVPFNRTPPVPNLSPKVPCKTEEIQRISDENALASLRKSGVNPLHRIYGHNPFHIDASDKIRHEYLPFGPYTPPPPLNELELDGIEFIELLNPQGRTPAYKVRIEGDLRVLKLFVDRDPDEEWDDKEIGWPQFRLRREKEAYAHLLRSGACKTGTVPYCYGWLTLSRGDMERVCALPADMDSPVHGGREDSPSILTDRRPPKALLLEYIPDAQVLSIATITPDIAEAALRSLCQIHQAYVLHGDIRRQNILVLPSGRVAWIDFDEATCASDPHPRKKLTRQKLFKELARTWALLYTELLPDKQVNFTHWLY